MLEHVLNVRAGLNRAAGYPAGGMLVNNIQCDDQLVSQGLHSSCRMRLT